MTETIQNRKRIVWIDVARGIGMLLVVIGHSNPPEWLKNFIFSFHMPLFFLLAGMVYRPVSDGNMMDGSKKDGHGENRSRNRVVRDFKQLIIPYMVVVAMTAVFLLIIRSEGGQGYYDSLKDLLRSALYASGSGHKGIKLIGEIWFLVAMFWGRRIMDAVFRFQEPLLRTLLVGGCVGISIALAFSKTWLPLDIDIAFLAAGFMYAGWAVQSFRDRKPVFNSDTQKAGTEPGRFFTPNVLCIMLMFSIAALSVTKFNMSSRRYARLWYLSLPGAVSTSLFACAFSELVSRVKGICRFFAFVGKHTLLFLCVTSLDWRMPFPRWGSSLIAPYSGESWFWILSAAHRFCFDLLIVVLLLLLKTVFSRTAGRLFRPERAASSVNHGGK